MASKLVSEVETEFW